MAGASQKRMGVWWDLNTCPVPAGVDPRHVLTCIESALKKEMGYRSIVHIYAMGNLEYLSGDLLKQISSSGIVLTHAPCGGHDLNSLLHEWSEHSPPPATVMLISSNLTMANPYLFQRTGYNFFSVYPKDSRPVTLDNPIDPKDSRQVSFKKEFVWETLLNDNNTCETIVYQDEEPLCICETCDDTFEICDEFITHLCSEEHIDKLSGIVPRDSYGEPKYCCEVCLYPGYNEYNMFLHDQSDEHNHKMAEKKAQEEDRESRKRNLQVDPFNESNKKQSFERGKQEEVSKE